MNSGTPLLTFHLPPPGCSHSSQPEALPERAARLGNSEVRVDAAQPARVRAATASTGSIPQCTRSYHAPASCSFDQLLNLAPLTKVLALLALLTTTESRASPGSRNAQPNHPGLLDELIAPLREAGIRKIWNQRPQHRQDRACAGEGYNSIMEAATQLPESKIEVWITGGGGQRGHVPDKKFELRTMSLVPDSPSGPAEFIAGDAYAVANVPFLESNFVSGHVQASVREGRAVAVHIVRQHEIRAYLNITANLGTAVLELPVCPGYRAVVEVPPDAGTTSVIEQFVAEHAGAVFHQPGQAPFSASEPSTWPAALGAGSVVIVAMGLGCWCLVRKPAERRTDGRSSGLALGEASAVGGRRETRQDKKATGGAKVMAHRPPQAERPQPLADAVAPRNALPAAAKPRRPPVIGFPDAVLQGRPVDIVRHVAANMPLKPKETVEIGLTQDVKPVLDAALSMGAQGIGRAVGIVAGLAQKVGRNSPQLHAWLSLLDVDFEDLSAALAAAGRRPGLDSETDRRLQEASSLLAEHRHLLVKTEAMEDAGGSGRLGPAQSSRRAAASREVKRDDGPADPRETVVVSMKEAWNIAKRMAPADGSGPGVRRQHPGQALEVFLPSPDALPHIHVTSKHVTFKSRNEGHRRLLDAQGGAPAHIAAARSVPLPLAVGRYLDALEGKP